VDPNHRREVTREGCEKAIRISSEELKAKYKQARETPPIMEEHRNALI
jgi:hypothetical protein